MRPVVFVAPFFLETTLRFVGACVRLPEVRMGLICQDPIEKLPEAIRARLVAHRRVKNALDPQQIADATRALAREIGTPERLIGALEELQIPLGEVREALDIFGMGASVARNFRDKSRMKTVLREAGLPCAEHGLATSSEEAHAHATSIGFPLVAKPPAGAGARRTNRLENLRALEVYLKAYPPSPMQPLLLEEFLLGEEHSLETISIAGKAVWHSLTRYYPSPLEVVENPWIQWCVLLPREVDHPRFDDIRRVGQASLEALGMGTGLTHMEWFRRRDGSVAVSEVGARPPGAQFTTITSYAHDFDLYEAWARLMVFNTFSPPERNFAAGAAYLRGQGQGRVKRIRGLEEAQRELGGLVVEARIPTKGQPSSGSYEGEGYVLVRHPETEVVKEALQRLVSLIRVEME